MLDQPHKLLLISTAVFLVFSLFVSDQTTDILIYDTYFVIGTKAICGTAAAVSIFYALLYWWTDRFLFSSFLSWTHVVLTILLITWLATASIWLPFLERSFGEDPFKTAGPRLKLQRVLASGIILLFLGQLTFIINLIVGLVRANHNGH